MLVITRRTGQGLRMYDAAGLYIGHLKVLGVSGDRVKLGIEADSRFVVMRDELIGNNESGTPVAALVSNNGRTSRAAS